MEAFGTRAGSSSLALCHPSWAIRPRRSTARTSGSRSSSLTNHGPASRWSTGTAFVARSSATVRRSSGRFDTDGERYQPLSLTDPLGRVWSFTYDEYDRTTKVGTSRQAGAAETLFAYDSTTQTTVTDPNGHKAVDPLGHARSQTWTANSSVQSVTDGLLVLSYRYYNPTWGRFTQPDPPTRNAAPTPTPNPTRSTTATPPGEACA
ncbi:hypothetical protein [Actinokineospora sp. UTMC 2448]|uniref:hypothetical protein n=1 Tax=Actinokineospora sp. UTMC 2448 TaxID=2268449 RepID=UPI0037C0561D